MTLRNPLVLVPGGDPLIQELPAGDTIGGAPQGLKGDAGLVWRGAWSSATSYAVDDAVSYQGASYIAITANTNAAPTVGGDSNWDVLSAKGDTGSDGTSTLVEQHTATSGDATMDFTTGISATYDEYVLQIIGFRPVTNSVNLALRAGTGAGPSWDTGSNYKWAINRTSDGAANTPTGSTGATTMVLANGAAGITNASTDTVDMTIHVKHPGDANRKPFYWNGYCFTASNINSITGGGLYASTTAITGLRLLFSSGNIAAGIARLYGINKT